MKIGIVTLLRPHPQRSGTRIRLFHFCRLLALRHEVYLADLEANASVDADAAAGYGCREIKRMPVVPVSLLRVTFDRLLFRPFSMDSRVRRALRAWMREHDFDVVIGAKSQGYQYATAAGIPARTLRLIDDGATAHRHCRAAATVESVLWKKIRLRLQTRKLATAERQLARSCHCLVTPSREEAAYLGAQFGMERVVIVPNGVDVEYFGKRSWRGEGSGEILFFGTFRFEANVDAARYLIDRILPLLPPETNVSIVGENPPGDILERATGDPRIHVTGYVDDLRPFLERCLAVVIPLRIGTGTRLKIVHAMAAGCPVISTRLGAEGIDAADGKEIVLADSAEAIARAVGRLRTDPAFARSIGLAGRRLAERSYDWTTIVADFERELTRRTARFEAGT